MNDRRKPGLLNIPLILKRWESKQALLQQTINNSDKIMKTIFLALIGALSMPCATLLAQEIAPSTQKAVLITGASTGIGRNMAETLAAEGFFVYAGARKQADIDALSAIDNIMGVRLDVTVQEEIDAAVATISAEGRGLFGLVNNAGVAVVGPLIETDEDDMQFQMDVNLFGPYRVTKAFAPLVIESRGRITTTGSISGILSGPLLGAYSMSKHGVEAFTDSLAVEMQKFDVHVSVIEPGNYVSAIVGTLKRRIEAREQSTEGSLYEEEMNRMLTGMESNYDKGPDEVSAALLKFLTDANPKRRYMVVPEQRQAEVTIRKAISELVQLNERHEYSYTRDELIKMLDEATDRPGDR
jgi:NAD(P)-dependent dehydrogenase (short-subunit alcohol dehydrogenase family)